MRYGERKRDHADRSFPGAARGRSVVYVSVWLLASAGTFADGLTAGQRTPSAGGATPNQGVSLEETAPQVAEIETAPVVAATDGVPSDKPSVFETGHKTTNLVGQPFSSPEQAAEMTATGTAPLEPRAKHAVRRHGAGGPEVASSRLPSVPWYRSGAAALAVVLVTVLGLFWLLRRWIPSMRLHDVGALRVTARVGLTPKHSVALIRLGRRFVLVGVSADQVRTLSEITDPDEVTELAAQIGVASSGGSGDFDRLLLREAADYHEAVEGAAASDESGVCGGAGRPLLSKISALADLKQRLARLRSIEPSPAEPGVGDRV